MQGDKWIEVEWGLPSHDANERDEKGTRRRLTIDNLAVRLASVGSKPKSYYARQIRNWAYRGLMEWDGLIGSGRTAGRVFDEDAVFRARLLSFLTNLGMKPDQMMPFSQLLEFADSIAERRVIDHVRAGEQIYIICLFDEDGQYLSSEIRHDSVDFPKKKRHACGGRSRLGRYRP